MIKNELQFGRSLRPEFMVSEWITQFNCASFGALPKTVFEKRLCYISQTESLPDYYLKNGLENKIIKTIKRLSLMVNCSEEKLVLIENAMQGINIVLKQFNFNEKDLIVHTSLAYKAIKNVLEIIGHSTKANFKQIDIKLGQSNLQILNECTELLSFISKECYKNKVLILEGISSTPAIVLPYSEIAHLFKQKGFVVIIDGAHCFGQAKIDFERSNADFFITNLYKWGFAPRPSALLCVKSPSSYKELRPLNITFNHNEPALVNRFLWLGTIDFSCMLSINQSLDFIEVIGQERIEAYNRNLCINGSTKVAEALGCSSFFVKNNEQIAFMSNIKLPNTPKVNCNPTFGISFEKRFLRKYKTQIKLFEYDNQWYLRLSSQIYLDIQDYETLGINLRKELFSSKF